MNDPLLNNYLNFCDSFYDLLLLENRTLKSNSNSFPPDFLDTKQSMLSQLDSLNQKIRSYNQSNHPTQGLQSNQLIDSLQKKILKLLLLVKENESLLYQNQFHQDQSNLSLPTSKNRASHLYKS